MSRQALTIVRPTLMHTKQTNENKTRRGTCVQEGEHAYKRGNMHTRGGTCVQQMINDDKVQFQDDRGEGLLRSVWKSFRSLNILPASRRCLILFLDQWDETVDCTLEDALFGPQCNLTIFRWVNFDDPS